MTTDPNQEESSISPDDPTDHSIILDKLTCARTQLDTAISLYFTDGDPVSIHTLASAAYELLRGINAARGGEPLPLEFAFLNLPDQKPLRKRMLQQFHRFQNFFKHADQDPEGTIEFWPRFTEQFLQHSEEAFKRFSTPTPQMSIFEFWHSALYFHHLPSYTQAQFPIEAVGIIRRIQSKYTRTTKATYYSKMLRDWEP
jgi:hypothetical protein